MTDARTCKRLNVCARGWLSDRWSQEYYPDDMPPEWRLTYYANEFPGVLVPREYWVPDAWPDVAQWREDVPERFRFFLEVDERLTAAGSVDRFVSAIRILGERLGGVLLLADESRAYAGIRDVIESSPGSPMIGAWAEISGLPGIWHGPDSPCPSAALGVLHPPTNLAPPELRRIVEAMADCVVEPEAWLFAGDDLQTLNDLVDMTRLLGL